MAQSTSVTSNSLSKAFYTEWSQPTTSHPINNQRWEESLRQSMSTGDPVVRSPPEQLKRTPNQPEPQSLTKTSNPSSAIPYAHGVRQQQQLVKVAKSGRPTKGYNNDVTRERSSWQSPSVGGLTDTTMGRPHSESPVAEFWLMAMPGVAGDCEDVAAPEVWISITPSISRISFSTRVWSFWQKEKGERNYHPNNATEPSCSSSGPCIRPPILGRSSCVKYKAAEIA